MQLIANGSEFEFALADGGTVFVCAYIGVDGLGRELAEGESFSTHDGCVATRRGGETVWWTPPGVAA